MTQDLFVLFGLVITFAVITLASFVADKARQGEN